MARITLWFLPASWYCGVAPRQKLLLLLAASVLLLLGTHQRLLRGPRRPQGTRFSKFLPMEATDVEDEGLNYGVVVDCGSSGSRVFVYYWPPHNGNPHTLLDIRQMRDLDRQPVVKKIKPGISSLATSPSSASDYLHPLLSFAAAHVPRRKHKETPLYILCTAGMRLLPDSQQAAILDDLVSDVPLDFDFLFSRSHAEVISGKQEGVYAWIGINFVLGRFDHADNEDGAVEVSTNSQHQRPISRRRTVGIMDMGGASLQIAYEVPGAITFRSPQEEEAAKSVLADFNLGCDVEHTQHVYRVYVTTFLGFGGNMARQRYDERIANTTLDDSRSPGAGTTGLSEDKPHLDPCLPLGLSHTLLRDNRTLYLRGQGDWPRCLDAVRPLLGLRNGTMTTAGATYQAPINFSNSEFYGFSEFYYCMEDVLRIGGQYDSDKYSRAATDFCATKWLTLKQRLDKKLFSQQADIDRLKYQCFKSAWMFQVLHAGFRFPADYRSLRTAQLVYDKEVQWTLGAILYKTRFLPLRDLQQEALRQSHPSWLRSSFVYNHHLFSLCLLVVVLAILLYVLRLRRIHRREQRQVDALDMLWVDEGEVLLP
ncbi:ectonucleoside triphosphate diphosphohydrolase 7 isoform X5 [Syngnathus scovelli]|uniref:ectonucleoside triphosphate diphosphohydrolase 7 isoform X5 n=1 Tax=Syngnathus scovelli TaxID=161590 RepID=UPI0035C9A357